MPWYANLLIALALLTLPFYFGGYLARKFRMPDHGWKFGLILCTLASGLVIITMRAALKGEDGEMVNWGIDLGGGVILVYEVDQDKKDPDKPVDMEKMIGAISLRVNPGGTRGVTVRRFGEEQIEIRLPKANETEAKRIERIISSQGNLEFRILANDRDHPELFERIKTDKSQKLWDQEKNLLAWWVPVKKEKENSIIGYEEIAIREDGELLDKVAGEGRRKQGKDGLLEVLVVNDEYKVTGEYLDRAETGTDGKGRPCVNFFFDAAGGHRFGGLTGDNLPDPVQDFTRKLAIILDGNLYSAPSINDVIFERGEITGSFTPEEVKMLVDVLNAGSLPTALTEDPISRLFTGPTLGADTIRKGSYAIMVSMVLVLLFMPFYYRFSGVVACLALLTNLILILAIMIAVWAEFTLPGLAGLVLTVGMAVDANVLVFERIREELARGAALRMAIRNGFARATTTIVDANLTTLIVATVLYAIGTDQVKGFAVILWLGVVLSMYTAIFCSRVVFDVAEKRRWISKLKMLRLVGKTKIDFLGKRRLAAAASIIVIAVGLVGVVARGKGLLNIDFTGGVSVEVLFDDPQDIARVRKALRGLPDLAVSDVRLEDEPSGKRFMINTSKSDATRTEKRASVIEVVNQQLKELLPTEADAEEHQAAIEALDEHLKQALEAERGSPERKAAVAAVKQQVKDIFAGGPDPQKRNAAIAEVDRQLEEVLQTAIGWVEGHLHEVFGEKLAANSLQVGDVAPIGPAQEKPVEEKEEEKAEKEKKPAATPPPKAPTETETPPADPFEGGTQAKLKFDQEIDRDALEEMFIDQFTKQFGSNKQMPLLELSNPEYREDNTRFDTWDVKIKLPPEQAQPILDAVKQTVADTPFFPSSNTIGGSVAVDARYKAVTALLISLLFIVGYIWIRFQRVIFGLAAVVALVHDVLITLGMIALSAFVADYLGFILITEFKIGLPVLAAFLTIIGYSLNDTIVVFDRIREVRGKDPRLTEGMINTSINQTLSRTLLTSLTTLLVVVILYIFGGQGIHGFAFALVVGVTVGTYSSIFVASPALFWMTRPSRAR